MDRNIEPIAYFIVIFSFYHVSPLFSKDYLEMEHL